VKNWLLAVWLVAWFGLCIKCKHSFFVSCILCCILSDDRASLIPYEAAAVNGEAVPMKTSLEYGRGQRKPAEKRPHSSDEEDYDNEGLTLSKQV